MVTGECEIARENHLITNYLISKSEVVTEKSQTKAWLGKCGKAEVWDFPYNDRTVEVIMLFIIWLTNWRNEKFIQGEVVSLHPAMSVSKFNSNFLAVFEINDMFSAIENAEIFVSVILGPKSYEWFQNRTSAQREFYFKIQVLFQTKIARNKVQLPLYYISFEITKLSRSDAGFVGPFNYFIDPVLSWFVKFQKCISLSLKLIV